MEEAQKMVFKVPIFCSKCKSAIFQAVAKIQGIDQVMVDGAKETVTVIGKADPVCVAEKLRKKLDRPARIVTVGPNKTEEKKDEKKDAKKDNKELPSCCSHCSGHTIIFAETVPGCTIV